MSKVKIPQNIPVIDFVNGIPFLKTTDEIERWKECHRNYVLRSKAEVVVTVVSYNLLAPQLKLSSVNVVQHPSRHFHGG